MASESETARRERLKAALRENLKRRKAQARARFSARPGAGDPQAGGPQAGGPGADDEDDGPGRDG